LDYIIVHELTHFLERNHNDRFVRYMNKFLPSWRTLKSELNSFILTYEKWDA
jgi:predicted metal-dependent hydrolase